MKHFSLAGAFAAMLGIERRAKFAEKPLWTGPFQSSPRCNFNREIKRGKRVRNPRRPRGNR